MGLSKNGVRVPGTPPSAILMIWTMKLRAELSETCFSSPETQPQAKSDFNRVPANLTVYHDLQYY
jgi:hypothetical protein